MRKIANPKPNFSQSSEKSGVIPDTLHMSVKPGSLTAFLSLHRLVLAGSLNFCLICEQRLVLSLVAKYDSLFKGTWGGQKNLEGFPCSALVLQWGEHGSRQKSDGHNVLLLEELD